MSDEQKPSDPADKAADGAFGGVQSHRAGYGDDKLQRLTEWLRAHPTATLASGEGALLLAEIDRLRVRCRQIDDEAYDYAEQIEQLKAEIDRLRERLTSVEAERDGAYGERNRVVAWAARMALALGFDVTVTKTAIHGWDTAWHNCIYVQTPEGQVSWHFHDQEVDVFADFPRGAVTWDGHSTPQKYDRVRTARYTNRAERILAALREPSEGMMGDVLEEYGPGQFVAFHRTRLIAAIRAAVAAAEQEVGRE